MLRGYLAFLDIASCSRRGALRVSNGDLPLERQFALGGIGTIHGYAFKEVERHRMSLMNAEYRLQPFRGAAATATCWRCSASTMPGRISGPLDGSTTDWLTGLGGGVSVASIRVEFGFRANDIPQSRQILVRFGPTF